MSNSYAICWQNNQFIMTDGHDETILEQAWVLPDNLLISKLHINNAMQYLTSMEADTAMIAWVKSLAKGGVLTVSVPDADYFARCWLDADWSNDTLKGVSSPARRAFAGLWGEQPFGNPLSGEYQSGAQGIYKSGYNERRLTLLLQRVGLFDVTVIPSEAGELCIKAQKTMDRGERQIVATRDEVRPDHLNRYQFAASQLQNKAITSILDLACGVGYGSQLLADATEAKVTAVDIDSAAIAHAQRYFPSPNIDYMLGDARTIPLQKESFDAIVSFETIEHVDFAENLVRQYAHWLRPGGILICSTPNQDVMPFDQDKFRFHVKHYTNDELLALLKQAGLTNVTLFAQHDPVKGEVVKGQDGHFTIAVAIKRLPDKAG